MDWIKGLQRAIDYIENNLLDEIDYRDIAKNAYSSSFQFQRTFSLLTGLTVGEYIRNRRLTLAGIELSMSKTKVIDIAMKYCYETPESFTKAFNRFHGITPTAAREPGAKLKSFNRLSIKIILEGGNIMDYRIEKRDSIKVLAKIKQISTQYDISTVDAPKFWTECYQDGTISTISANAKSGDLFGICIDDNFTGDESFFRYAIGAECTNDIKLPGYEIVDIPANTWAVFKCVGAMPDAIQKMQKRIYSEFLPQSDYEVIPGMDFEYYYEGDNSKADYVSEIWLPVKKKL